MRIDQRPSTRETTPTKVPRGHLFKANRQERPALFVRFLRVSRLIAGYGAVASALPYLGLKLVWLTGGTLGVADRTMMRETSMIVLNGITAGMDLVGIGLAMAFTHRWGLRVPAWLLLPPIWVATGFLATFVVAVPIAAVVSALVSDSLPRVTSGPVQPWVYVVVYTEFAGLGMGLLVGFILYARTRWAETLRSPVRAHQPGATHDVQVPLANAAAVAALALGALYLAWALGATVGLTAEAAARRTIVGHLINGIDGALALGAAAGLLMMVRRIGKRTPFWVPLALTWVGAGSLFGWGLWQMINVVGQTALVRGAERLAFVNLIGLLRMIVGLVMGLLSGFLLAERRAHASRLSLGLSESPTKS